MKCRQQRFLRNHPFFVDYFPVFLFLIAVVINIITTHYVSYHYIDSDTSSELILAQHWIETGTPLSPDWLYGSELRLFHAQLIYVPLMLLLDDWQLIRFIGILIMQALYITSFGCLVRATGHNKKFFYYGASMLLLPVSVVYGRIVLYHNHYLPNITISFFLLALALRFSSNVDWHNRKTWLRLLLLAMVSFAGGLNSIRQLLITHAPLLLTSVVLCWIDDAKSANNTETAFLKPSNLTFLLCCVFSAAFSLLGLKTNRVLCDKLGIYVFVQSENNTLSLMDAEYLNDMLYGFFHQFGFRKGIPMLSLNGILSLGSIFIGCYLLFISVKQIMQSYSPENKRQHLLSLFFLAHVTVTTVVFLVTSGTNTPYYYPLYYALCYPWAVPLILTHLGTLQKHIHPLHVKKLFPAVALILLLLSGTVNIFYFQGSDHFPQIYEGLRFQNRDKKAELVEVVSYLTEQGFDKGYADHWESGIITEMTNGSMPMVPIDFSRDYANDNGNLQYQDTLSSLWLRESPCEKPFLILTETDAAGLVLSDSMKYCTQVYIGSNHIIYTIDELEAFVETLSY